jgi:hypothetical protein
VRRFSVRMGLATSAVVLAGSGIALAAFDEHTSAPRVDPVIIRGRPSSPVADAAASPPLVARVFSQAATTNRAAVYEPRPVNTSPPTISGAALQGQLVTEAHGGWSGGPTSYGYQWARCNGAGSGCQSLGLATAQSYLLGPSDVGSTIRVYETASNGSGEGGPAVSTQTGVVGAAPLAPPPPVLGERGVATVLAGVVRIRLKGTNRFILLSGSAGIPNDSEVDATHGRVRIAVARTKRGGIAQATAYGGAFLFHQGVRSQTRFALSLPLRGCPALDNSSRRTTGTTSLSKHRNGPKARKLWVSEDGGNWSTTGRYVSTTVEGTRWLTLDQCTHSIVAVVVGRVRVHNLITDAHKVISAGTRYVASSRARGLPSE